jgi:hypothetical protein
MLEKMPIIGAKIRRKMPFIPQDTTIDLIMDNAGGHGTQEAIDEYTVRLQREFNIRIKHQAPWSPETNALDLGIWCSIQSAVEKLHRNRQRGPDTLAASVRDAWENLPSDKILRVFNRILVVL